MIKNPITNKVSPDPFIIFDDQTKYYYFLNVESRKTSDFELKIYRSKKVKDIAEGQSIVAFKCGENGINFGVWAPEMHKDIDGKWYIYTSGFTSFNMDFSCIKLFVLRSKTADPFDGFEFVRTFDEEIYAFDPTIYIDKNQKRYMCYTQVMTAYGFEGWEQRLFIREMVSPTQLGEKKAEISKAELPFELSQEVKINEGAFFLTIKDKLFIVYSANGCGDENYCLCVLEYVGGDLIDKNSWKKWTKPLLYKSEKLFGTGHANFFYSPDKSELWCSFHSIIDMVDDDKPFRDRFACLNKVEIDENGYPVMGKAKEIEFSSPKGE